MIGQERFRSQLSHRNVKIRTPYRTQKIWTYSDEMFPPRACGVHKGPGLLHLTVTTSAARPNSSAPSRGPGRERTTTPAAVHPDGPHLCTAPPLPAIGPLWCPQAAGRRPPQRAIPLVCSARSHRALEGPLDGEGEQGRGARPCERSAGSPRPLPGTRRGSRWRADLAWGCPATRPSAWEAL